MNESRRIATIVVALVVIAAAITVAVVVEMSAPTSPTRSSSAVWHVLRWYSNNYTPTAREFSSSSDRLSLNWTASHPDFAFSFDACEPCIPLWYAGGTNGTRTADVSPGGLLLVDINPRDAAYWNVTVYEWR